MEEEFKWIGEVAPPALSYSFYHIYQLLLFMLQTSISFSTHMGKPTLKVIQLLHVESLGVNIGFLYILWVQSTSIIRIWYI